MTSLEMTQSTAQADTEISVGPRRPKLRLWIALGVTTGITAAVIPGLQPFTYVAPAIGIALTFGAPPDHLGEPRSIARRPRNLALGVALVAALAGTIWQPQLVVPLVDLFGTTSFDVAFSLLAVIAMGLPLAMVDGPRRPSGGFLLTRRNLIASLTVVSSVVAWYSGPAHSFVPLAVLVLTLPVVIGVSRVVAIRRHRLEYGLLRRPFRPGLGPHRLQLTNVVLFCALMALTVPTGAYAAVSVQMPGSYGILLGAFVVGLVILVLTALVPLRQVRLGSNLLVAAGTIFLAAQLILLYRPPVDAVTIGSPLAQEWWVGQGGRAELVNYHHNGPMQSHALDIMQVGAGGIHRPDSTDLTSYYIYDQPVLAPAEGTVTFVINDRLDQPIGTVDERHPSGNQVVIDLGGDRFLLLAHLRQGSISVSVGDQVQAGQPIARVGNSGHSSAPHIHIQAQTLPTAIGDITAVDLPQMLRTLHTYPLLFRDVRLVRDGVTNQPAVVDPRRGDLVRPAVN